MENKDALISRKYLYDKIAKLQKTAIERLAKTPKGSPEHFRYFERFNEISNLKNEIMDAPTVEVPEWIPCSERLPEESGEYLVWYDCGEDMEGCCVENFDAGVGAFGRWFDEYDEYTLGFLDSEFIYFDEAVAWMPLPEPNKGE